MSYDDWQCVIGLEIHAQLKTKTKIFAPDSTEFGCSENENTCPISLGMPGALPLPNEKAVEYAVKTGLALGCKINKRAVFSRKNYFYPDLPKGYQITQFDQPTCSGGQVEILLDGEKKVIGIERAHMEEDAGKSIHQGNYTLIDLNRAGIPLIEIVSRPDMRSPKEAAEFARTVRNILRYIDVCDGNLEEGSLRCDCNVSVMKKDEKEYRTRVEIKNINSFKFAEKAMEYEIQRQIDCYESGVEVIQETRLYDSTKNQTAPMREKANAHDYRYFPEPDLLPVILEESYIQKIREDLPELPLDKAHRFQKEYKIPEYDAFILTGEREMADYFETAAKKSGKAKAASNWIMGELLRLLKDSKQELIKCKIKAEQVGDLIALIDNKTISGKIAKKVF